jgi:hypothetical protein
MISEDWSFEVSTLKAFLLDASSNDLNLKLFYDIAYFKSMLCFLQVSIISSGHIEDCTSPI